jgi:hypothetical protein
MAKRPPSVRTAPTATAIITKEPARTTAAWRSGKIELLVTDCPRQMKEPSEHAKATIAQAACLRGSIITSYAQVEHLLGDIVMRCWSLPEYATLPKSFPYKLKTRIARVRELLRLPGPLSIYSDMFEDIIVELQQYEELRHFMAHGLISVLAQRGGGYRLFYRMHSDTKAGPQEGSLDLDLEELEAYAKMVAQCAQRAVTLFRNVYMAHRLQQP